MADEIVDAQPFNPLHAIVSPESMTFAGAAAVEIVKLHPSILRALAAKAIDGSGTCNVKAALGLVKHIEVMFEWFHKQTGMYLIDMKSALQLESAEIQERIERSIHATMSMNVAEMDLEQVRMLRDRCDARILELTER